TADQIAAAGIDVAAVGSGTLARRFVVPGTIIPHADRIARVSVKLSGTVAELRKKLGDQVAKDEVLAVLESREVADAKSEYRAARLADELQKGSLRARQGLACSPRVERTAVHWFPNPGRTGQDKSRHCPPEAGRARRQRSGDRRTAQPGGRIVDAPGHTVAHRGPCRRTKGRLWHGRRPRQSRARAVRRGRPRNGLARPRRQPRRPASHS